MTEEPLKEIAERTKRIEKIVNQEPRLIPNIDSELFSVLKYVRDNPGCESGDVSDGLDVSNKTRTLSTLYYSYLVDRDDSRPHEYEISPMGESVYQQVTEQQTLKSNTNVMPWADIQITRSKYIVLHLIEKNGPTVTKNDIADEYSSFGYSNDDDNPAVGAVLSSIYNDDRELVLRSEFETPFRYKLGSAGKELLDDHGVEDITRFKE